MSIRLYYKMIDKYIIVAKLAGPMHVGSGDDSRIGILLHPNTGLPFIQASSITGALRDYYSERFGEKDASALFGGQNDENEHSKVRITDGLFRKECIELRPRLNINPETGSVNSSEIKGTSLVSGHKFDMEYIGAGAELSFVVYVYRDSEYEQKLDEQLRDTFYALNNGEIVLGGQKSNGCGEISIEHLYHKLFDLEDEADRKEWLNESVNDIRDFGDKDSETKEKIYDDIVDEIKESIRGIYRIRVVGRVESEILVKGYQTEDFGKDAPGSVNIRNAQGEYIIPGSSLKGAIRSRVKYIKNVLGMNDNVIDEMFGSSVTEEKGIVGNTRFYDAVIGKKEDNDKRELKRRIHIDKFTGGVFYEGLFSEKNAYGAIEDIRIDVVKKNNPERAVGLLILALRDLANGLYNLGSGYHIGHGFISVDRIELQQGDSVAKINFSSGKIEEDNNQMISKCLEMVQKNPLSMEEQ